MSIQAKREYISILWDMYRKAVSRSDKGRILTQICEVLGMHRKSAIRLLRKKSVPRLRRSAAPRANRIPDDVRKAICVLWHKMGRMGTLAMHAALPEWLGFELDFSCELKLRILKVSHRSMERIVRVERSAWLRKHNTGTKKSRKPVTIFPLRPLGIPPTEVGHIEIDTVAHCGDSMSGTFAWTVTATDILSNWTDVLTIWGKNSDAVCLALKIMKKGSPIKWKAIYVDNGSEFVNETIEAYFSKPNEKRLLKGFWRDLKVRFHLKKRLLLLNGNKI